MVITSQIPSQTPGAPWRGVFLLFPLAAVVAALLVGGGCRGDEGRSERSSPLDDESAVVAMAGDHPADGDSPRSVLSNRTGVPTSGGAILGAASGETKGDDDDEPKDYWAPIPFNRSDFDEVRKMVRDRYIDAKVDDGRAYAEAAAFALASDEQRTLVLLPESFYEARKDNPDEEGDLDGTIRKVAPTDKFVILEPADKPEKKRERKSDDELRELREKRQARTRELDKAWHAIHFGPRDFDRVMDYVSAELGKGKDSTWTMKRAWVAAAQGYLYSLDPHSSLIPKAAWEDSTKEVTDASFEGIGAILTRRPDSDYTIVESPIEGQPAVKAGLRAGDLIIKVDGKDIAKLALSKVVKRIRGPKNTTVTLTVEREGEPDYIDVPIVRGHISITNVAGKLVKAHNDMGYIKITGFVPTTTAKLSEMYAELSRKAKSRELRGLILDLRNNSGGLLKQGIQVADRFLGSGPIVTVKSRHEDDETHLATANNHWSLPLVVLVNDASASAAEIVASAIQENGRGYVIGDRTFGKASVQTLFTPFWRDSYYVKLTVARYFSPNGRTLQVTGVHPDVYVPPDFSGKMPLGFREENLSHHLPPLDSAYLAEDRPEINSLVKCAEDNSVARKLHDADPNPAVKFDYQLAYAADFLECMIARPNAQASR